MVFFRFSVPLTIVKGTLLDQDQAQNGVWLEPLLEQVDSTGIQIKFFNLKHPFFCTDLFTRPLLT
jgi:hypothetical protein